MSYAFCFFLFFIIRRLFREINQILCYFYHNHCAIFNDTPFIIIKYPFLFLPQAVSTVIRQKSREQRMRPIIRQKAGKRLNSYFPTLLSTFYKNIPNTLHVYAFVGRVQLEMPQQAQVIKVGRLWFSLLWLGPRNFLIIRKNVWHCRKKH